MRKISSIVFLLGTCFFSFGQTDSTCILKIDVNQITSGYYKIAVLQDKDTVYKSVRYDTLETIVELSTKFNYKVSCKPACGYEQVRDLNSYNIVVKTTFIFNFRDLCCSPIICESLYLTWVKQNDSKLSNQNKLKLIALIKTDNDNGSNIVWSISASRDLFEKKSVSAKRAENVRSFLVKNGIPNERIKINDVGVDEPMISEKELSKIKDETKLEEELMKNRNVVFRIYSH